MASSKRTLWTLLGGVAGGAAAWYFLDRENGARRRAAFAKKADQLGQQIAKGAELSFRDVENRFSGMARHAWTSLVRPPLDDRIHVERVRARMGRVVAHPHKIHVTADDGVITLWGEATEQDARRLVDAVAAMPGVRGVQNELDLCPPLGAASKAGDVFTQARHQTLLRWSPARRLFAGTAGSAAALYGWRRKDELGALIALVGGALVTHSISRRNVPSLLAFSDESPGFELDRTIKIKAPISDVYQFWANPENYPKVFSHIAAIERLGENLYRWTMNGPAGLPIHWEGRITRTVPNTSVEWKSLPGSTVGNFGIAHFDANYDASTRLRVRMFYRPPAGILGRFVAELFGSAPGKVLDQDLRRLKFLFEKDASLFEQMKEGGDEQLLKIATT
jgi:uncharacterized membrane protein